MVGLILDLGAVITCPHGGRVSPVTVNSRVLLNGMPALLVSDSFPIADCPFETPIPDGDKPQPCTEVRWRSPAARVLVDGRPVLVATSAGQCLSAEHNLQGPPMPSGVQPRVTAH
jgi:hypothetical protein